MSRTPRVLLGALIAALVVILAGYALLGGAPTDGDGAGREAMRAAAGGAAEGRTASGSGAETSGAGSGAAGSAAATAQPTLYGLDPGAADDGARLPLRYDLEYPTIDYAGTPLTGRLGTLEEGLTDGSVVLEDAPERGLLDSLLAVLGIDTASQMMVFSKTSLQVETILPATPRAIYFNDDTYVAYVQGAGSLEIGSVDPVLGPVFHTLGRDGSGKPVLRREDNRCLRCHDSLSLTGGGVPRFLLGSGYIGTEGDIVSHEAWILMYPWTPLRSRWGGWYVTGTHGDQVHLGNIVVEDIADLQDVESLRVGNIDSLEGLIDTSPYPTPYSDIVALLVVQQQVQTQNDIVRTQWDLRTALGVDAAGVEAALAALPQEERNALLYEHTEVLIESLVNAFGVELTAPVAGAAGFREWFEARGPHDAEGRSLRDLDLETRVFRYPLSYLIYSDAFAAIPRQAREYIYRRLREELEGAGRLDLSAIPAPDREAALAILAATHAEFR